MFEIVCLRDESIPALSGEGLDLGALAEAMVFYQRVHLVGRKGALEHLLRHCGPDLLMELLSEGHLTFAYQPEWPVVLTEHTGTPAERHLPTVVRFGDLELQDVLPKVCEEVTGARGKGRRLARRLDRHLATFIHGPGVEGNSSLDFRDVGYVTRALELALDHLAPEYSRPGPLRVDIEEAGEGRVRVKTNVDFNAANRAYHSRVSPRHSTLSPAYLLAHLVTVRSDLDTAAQLGAEMAVTPISSALARTKVGSILDRYAGSTEQIDRFQELVLEDARTLREVINGGERSLADLLPVLRNASRFRQWLAGREAGADLIKEYYRAVTRDSWLDRLPAKVARFAVVSLAGMAIGAAVAGPQGTALGLGLGAADSFLLEKISRGWRPSQFVEGPLKQFRETD